MATSTTSSTTTSNESVSTGEIETNVEFVEQKGTIKTTATATTTNESQINLLNSAWTLYISVSASSKSSTNWSDLVKQLNTFSSVQEFWGTYNNCMTTTQLPNGTTYYLFREGIFPQWEDEANVGGGALELLFDKTDKREDFEKLWVRLMLACIGETTTASLLVNGCTAAVRKDKLRIQVWIRKSDDATRAELIRQMIELTQASPLTFKYKPHSQPEPSSRKY